MKKVENKGDRVRVVTITEGPSLTDQHFKDLTDVNVLMKKYDSARSLAADFPAKGFYADISEVGDYHQSLQKVLDANAAFMQLDPNVRARFNNDPGALLDFMSDSKNQDEAVKLGIINKPVSSNAQAPISNDDLTTISKEPEPVKHKASVPS